MQVPWLRSGTGATPEEGGCILQVLDWIHRGKWTDDPPCVHFTIREMAIELNDEATDTQRQRLLDLAPRMIGTGDEFPEIHPRLIARRLNDAQWDADYDEDSFAGLIAMLDEFEKMTGRTRRATLDYSGVCAVLPVEHVREMVAA